MLTVHDEARYWLSFCLPHPYSTPPLGGSCRNIATTYRKSRRCSTCQWKKSEDIITRFDFSNEVRMYEHDRQTPHKSIDHVASLRSFHYSLYVRCILSWGRALGPLGGLSTGQLNCCLPRMEKKREEKGNKVCTTAFIKIFLLFVITMPLNSCSFSIVLMGNSTTWWMVPILN